MNAPAQQMQSKDAEQHARTGGAGKGYVRCPCDQARALCRRSRNVESEPVSAPVEVSFHVEPGS